MAWSLDGKNALMWQRYASLFWEAYVCGNLKNGMRLAINTVIDQEFYVIIQGLSEGRQHLTPKWVFAPWKFKQLSRKMNHLEQVNGFSSCKQYKMIRHLVLPRDMFLALFDLPWKWGHSGISETHPLAIPIENDFSFDKGLTSTLMWTLNLNYLTQNLYVKVL